METVLPNPVVQEQPAADSAPATTRPAPAWLLFLQHLGAILLSLALAAGALWVYTRNNDFPAFNYHPDEYGKVYQLTGRMSHNFNHPLLMLESAQRMIDWLKAPNDTLSIAIAGRDTSATLASIGVFAAAMTGYLAYGFIGLLLCGAAVALCPALMINAHFFKEDTSLICGILLAILGARWSISAKTLWTQLPAALLLGLGCGAAASGKYVGGITILPAIAALFLAPMKNWYALPLRVALCFIAMLLTVRTVNHIAFVPGKAFELMPAAQEGFYDETHHAAEGHYGLGLRKPNSYWLRIGASETLPHIWLMIGAGLLWWALRPRFSRWALAMLLFPLTFAALLSFNTIPMARYALPITISFYFIGAQLASAMVVDWHKRLPRWSIAGGAVCFGAVLLVQGHRVLYLNDKFAHDSREAFHDFVATLPAGVTVASDNHTGINGDVHRYPDQPPLRVRLRKDTFRNVCELAPTVDDLARQGVQYVAIADLNWARFFDLETHGIGSGEETFQRQKQFYQDLFDRADLVWSSTPVYPTHAWVDIDLRLYDITHLKPRSQDASSSGPQKSQS
jgi:hypothetical protein